MTKNWMAYNSTNIKLTISWWKLATKLLSIILTMFTWRKNDDDVINCDVINNKNLKRKFQQYYDFILIWASVAYVLLLPYHSSWSYELYLGIFCSFNFLITSLKIKLPLKVEENIFRGVSGHTIADIVPGYVCNKN